MTRIITLVIASIAGGAAFAALLALLPFLIREPVQKSADMLRKMPGRSFAIGLVNALFFLAVAIVASRIGEASSGVLGGLSSLIALTILWGLLAFVLVGAAGLVIILNRRMQGTKIEEWAPIPRSLLITSLFFVAALLAPLAGWFILAPLVIVICLGAAIMGLLQWLRT